MYKQLYGTRLLENQFGKDVYFTLHDVADYVTSNEYIDGIDSNYWSHKLPQYNKTYKNNLINLKDDGLPTKQSEQFNFANLHKLYSLEILNSQPNQGLDLEKFGYLANQDRTIVLNDSNVVTTNDLGKKAPFNVQILDSITINKNRMSEYIQLLDQEENLSKLTYALSPFPNIIIFPSGSKESFKKNPLNIQYLNSGEDPKLDCNTTIFDVQYNTKVQLNETVKTTSGQMNYSMYILRENSELVINRKSKDSGGWNIFDSVFICHPGSKLTVNFTNTGSQYTQENFYINSSSKTTVNIKGRNKIFRGNNYHQYVYQKSDDPDNYSSIDIKNVGKEFASTSFIGRYDVGALSIDFDGDMNNQNLMLDKNVKMHTRPILDIHTKEIKCQHGCTVSNVNEDHVYYLQSKGMNKSQATDLLVESFLC